MKKILVLIIVISLILNSSVNFVYSQDSPLSIDFDSYLLQCVPFKPLSISDLETEEIVTSAVSYVSELEHFTGKTDTGLNFESFAKDFVLSLALGFTSDLVSSLIGKVPVGASEVNADIRNSIKESTKNILASIKTSVQLAINDALNYLKFQLINKINDLIYAKLLNNFIKDIEAYKNLKIFLAYMRGFKKSTDKIKNLECIPEELRGCLINNIQSAQRNALPILKASEGSSSLNKFFNAFLNSLINNIFDKEICSPEDALSVYQQLSLSPPISPDTSDIYFAFNERPKQLITKIEKPKSGLLASIFNIFTLPLKNLKAQIANQENGIEGLLYFDIDEILNRQTYLENCALLTERFLGPIFAEVNKTQESLNLQFQQPGGLSFKPKNECLKTWTQIEWEEKNKDLIKAMEKGDEPRIKQLEKELQILQERIHQEKDISGEDPLCLIPGVSLSAPSDYERLKEQILTSPLDFFKSQERVANVLIAFIRSWLATKLFKIIDKGFASLEAKSAKSEVVFDIQKAYSQERINAICNKMDKEKTGIPGLTATCKTTLESQAKKIDEINKNYTRSVGQSIAKGLNFLNSLSSTLTNILNTTTLAINELKDIENLKEEVDALVKFEETFKTYQDDLIKILAEMTTSSKNIENLLTEFATFTNATITQLQQQLDDKVKEIASIEQEINNEINFITNKLNQLYSYSYGTYNRIPDFFSNLPSNFPNSGDFPQKYIAYYDDISGKLVEMEGCRMDYDPPISTPAVEKKTIKLPPYSSFHFYSTHIHKDSSWYETIGALEQRLDKSDFERYSYCNQARDKKALFFLAHDLFMIYFGLYNTPLDTQKVNIVLATTDYLNKILNEEEKIATDTLNILYNYFEKIYLYVSTTKQYITERNRLIKDMQFRYAKEKNKFSPEKGAITLVLGQTVDTVYNISEILTEILDKLRNETLLKKIWELNAARGTYNTLLQQYETEIDNLWKDYLEKFDLEAINQISRSLNENTEKINSLGEEIYSVCNSYNDLILKIKNKVSQVETIEQEEKELLPPEESPSGKSTTQKPIKKPLSLIQRILSISKVFVVSIFDIFNIFKEKSIYLK